MIATLSLIFRELLNITVSFPPPKLQEITKILEKKTEFQEMYEQFKARFIEEKTGGEGVIIIDSD